MNKDKQTRQDKLLELFPNVRLSGSLINIMPCIIDTEYQEEKCETNSISCLECAEKYWSEVAK